MRRRAVRYHHLISCVLAAVAMTSGMSLARADEPGACSPIRRENVVPCALRASLALAREHREGEVRDARVLSARPFLPSNPVLSASLAHRGATGDNKSAVNWTATLGQELDIGGQRAAGRRAAESDVLAQKWRTAATEREVAALAWLGYFDVLGARDELALAERLEQSVKLAATAARGRADKGLLSDVEADVAEATLLRVQQSRVQAATRLRNAQSVLATMTGADPAAPPPVTDGELAPLVDVDALTKDAVERIQRERPEVQALKADEHTFEERTAQYRRARVPNLTVSLFMQNDGYNERVYGAGVGVPIPVPGLGRTYAGEIAEAQAQAKGTSVERARIEREIGLEIARAALQLEAKKSELALFTDDRAARAERLLMDMAKEIEAGRLAIRDAVVAQDRLMELLRARLEARKAVCVASVELSRAAGVPLERGGR